MGTAGTTHWRVTREARGVRRRGLAVAIVLAFLVGQAAAAMAAGSPSPSPSPSPARLALVIGNAAYALSPLRNPENDAALMSTVLGKVGFEVHHHTNLDRRGLTRAFYAFAERLQETGQDTVALIYYAGHGAQLRGENYLIPVGSKIEEALDIEIEGVRASSLLQTLNRTGNRLNIVVFDACRNNPFLNDTRSATRGLARMDAPTGTLLAYSTAPGRTAVDGDGRNSPYTQALANSIQSRGLKVEEVFKRVRISVMDRTGDTQVPWESSSLTGDFYFVEPVAGGSSEEKLRDEVALWQTVISSGDPESVQSYLDRYPDGVFADAAKQQIAALTDSTATQPHAPGTNGDAVLKQGVFDGKWQFKWAQMSQEKDMALCHAGETVASEFVVSNGKFNTVLTSNHGNTGRLTGAVGSDGAFRADITGDAWLGEATVLGNAGSGIVVDQVREPECRAAIRFDYLDFQNFAPVPNQALRADGYNGRYFLTVEVVGGYNPWGFCRKGERAEEEFEVRDQSFNLTMRSSLGSAALVSGIVSKTGQLSGKFQANGWPAPKGLTGNLAPGELIGVAGRGSCWSKYSISYLGSLDSVGAERSVEQTIDLPRVKPRGNDR